MDSDIDAYEWYEHRGDQERMSVKDVNRVFNTLIGGQRLSPRYDDMMDEAKEIAREIKNRYEGDDDE